VTNGAEGLLHGGHRVIRLVAGDAESPWPGALVCTPDGETAVAVDAAILGADWAGWGADSAGHLLAPVDVIRRADGHDVLLPVCTERLEDFLARRSAGTELSIGEAVTIAVSLLRGLTELPPASTGVCGTWWLTDAGRPVAATGTGTASLEEQTGTHLRELAADAPSLAAVLADAAAAMTDPRRRTRELERAETVIFAVADPLALATTTFGPRRARDRAAIDTLVEAEDTPPAHPLWIHSLARHLDADWADLVSRTTTGVWRSLRTPRPGRRRPWLLAGGLAGVVLTGGLLWPTGGAGPATAEVSTGSTPVASSDPAADEAPDEAAAGSPAETPPLTEPVDLAAIATELLDARRACSDDAECLAGVLESSGAPFPGGVVDLPAEQRTVALLDEFGGAAVLRAEASAADSQPQLVVIVRTDRGWLLRDVYDVPEQ
jgi:hypothetical protein